MRWLLFGLLCTFIACAPRHVIRYSLDPAFDRNERQNIEHAMWIWERDTGCLLFSKESLPHRADVKFHRVSYVQLNQLFPGRAAIGMAEGSHIWIAYDQEELLSTSAHEVGHFLRLRYDTKDPPHSTDPKSLMRAAGGELDRGHIPRVDLEAFRRLGPCAP